MATWQFDLRPIPRRDLERHFGASPLGVSFDDLEEVNTTFPFSLSSLADRVNLFLLEGDSWSRDMRQWGEEERTRIDVWKSGDRIDSILVRIDARQLNSAFLVYLAELGRDFDLVFVSSNAEVLPPNPRRLFQALANSSAAKFVEDPEAFLANLPSDDR